VAYLQRAVPFERVVKITGEFSLDDLGNLWLVYTSDCRTVPQPLFSLDPVINPTSQGSAAAPEASSDSPPTTTMSSLGASSMLEKQRPQVTLPNGTTVPIHYWGVPDVSPISHREITELKASPNLHPKVQIIAATVAQCVTGVARTWEKASMGLRGGGVSEFVRRMRDLEACPGQHMSEGTLESLLPTLTSPLFDVQTSLPFMGALGERLGNWALGVCSATGEWYGVDRLENFPTLLRVYAVAEAAGLAKVALVDVGMRQFSSGLNALAAADVAVQMAAATASLLSDQAVSALRETREEKKMREIKASLASSAFTQPHPGRKFLHHHGASAVTPTGSSTAADVALPLDGGAGKKGGSSSTTLVNSLRGPSPSISKLPPLPPPPIAPIVPELPPPIPGSTNSGRFVCSDGISSMQWAILGKRDPARPALTSLVIVNDFFDTLGHAAAAVEEIVAQGAHVLIFNLPGQAFSHFQEEEEEEEKGEGASSVLHMDPLGGSRGGGSSPAVSKRAGTGIHTTGRAPSPEFIVGTSAMEDSAFVPNPQVVQPGSLDFPKLPLTAIIAANVQQRREGGGGSVSMGAVQPLTPAAAAVDERHGFQLEPSSLSRTPPTPPPPPGYLNNNVLAGPTPRPPP